MTQELPKEIQEVIAAPSELAQEQAAKKLYEAYLQWIKEGRPVRQ